MFSQLKKAEIEISKNRENIISDLVKLSVADLLFFWGSEKKLIESQEKVWGPIILWLEKEMKSKVVYTHGLELPKQEQDMALKIEIFLHTLTNKELVVFNISTLTLSSVLLAATFVKRKLNAEEVFNAAFIEELVQNEEWGAVSEAEERRIAIKKELKLLEGYLDSND